MGQGGGKHFLTHFICAFVHLHRRSLLHLATGDNGPRKTNTTVFRPQCLRVCAHAQAELATFVRPEAMMGQGNKHNCLRTRNNCTHAQAGASLLVRSRRTQWWAGRSRTGWRWREARWCWGAGRRRLHCMAQFNTLHLQTPGPRRVRSASCSYVEWHACRAVLPALHILGIHLAVLSQAGHSKGGGLRVQMCKRTKRLLRQTEASEGPHDGRTCKGGNTAIYIPNTSHVCARLPHWGKCRPCTAEALHAALWHMLEALDSAPAWHKRKELQTPDTNAPLHPQTQRPAPTQHKRTSTPTWHKRKEDEGEVVHPVLVEWVPHHLCIALVHDAAMK